MVGRDRDAPAHTAAHPGQTRSRVARARGSGRTGSVRLASSNPAPSGASPARSPAGARRLSAHPSVPSAAGRPWIASDPTVSTRSDRRRETMGRMGPLRRRDCQRAARDRVPRGAGRAGPAETGAHREARVVVRDPRSSHREHQRRLGPAWTGPSRRRSTAEPLSASPSPGSSPGSAPIRQRGKLADRHGNAADSSVEMQDLMIQLVGVHRRLDAGEVAGGEHRHHHLHDHCSALTGRPTSVPHRAGPATRASASRRQGTGNPLPVRLGPHHQVHANGLNGHPRAAPLNRNPDLWTTAHPSRFAGGAQWPSPSRGK